MSFLNRSVRAIARQANAASPHCAACSTLVRITSSSSSSPSSSSAACTILPQSTSRLRLQNSDVHLSTKYQRMGRARGVATMTNSTEVLSTEEEAANKHAPVEDEAEPPSSEEAISLDGQGKKERPRYVNIYDRPDPPPGAPTVEDLVPFRPRRIFVPTSSSGNAERILYMKDWNKTHRNLYLNFTKAQLSKLVEILKLDLQDERLKIPTRRKPNKLGNSKRKTHVDALTRSEMCRLILVLEWDLPDPETLPSVKRSPTVVEDIPISPRTLFLLLLPSSTTLQYLRENLGLKITPKQDANTHEAILTFKGERDTIKTARVTIDNILDTVYQSTIQLPKAATTLRPEVFQTISRTSKVFLERTESESRLLATAASVESVTYATKLIEHALHQDAVSNSTPLLALLSPPSFTPVEHAMYPFTSLSAPLSWSQTGATTDLARIKKVKVAAFFNMGPTGRGREDGWDVVMVDGKEAESRDGKEPGHREQLKSIPTKSKSVPDRKRVDILEILREDFPKTTEGRVKVEMKFGHVIWPLYSQEMDHGVMEPSRKGKFLFERFNLWRKDHKKAFVSSTSPMLLNAIDPAPINANPWTTPTLSVDNASTAQSEDEPTFLSTELRRLTYRPEKYEEEGKLKEIIEVDFKEAETNARLIRRSLVDLMVPEAGADFQVCMAIEQDVTSDLKNSDGLPTFDIESPTTQRIVLNNTNYILDSDKTLRTTIITPAPSSSPLTFIQEKWEEKLFAEPNGVSISVSVGEGALNSEEVDGMWSETVKDVLQVAKFGLV